MTEYSTILVPLLAALFGGLLVVFAWRRPAAQRRQGLLVTIAFALSLAASAAIKQYFGLSVWLSAVLASALSVVFIAVAVLLAKRLAG